jgi:hypothetical protein
MSRKPMDLNRIVVNGKVFHKFISKEIIDITVAKMAQTSQLRMYHGDYQSQKLWQGYAKFG